MRDLLFKNLTSADKKRKVILSSEITDKKGLRRIIRRHFICAVKEFKDNAEIKMPAPYLYVLKEHNEKEQREKFFCRIKGAMCTVTAGKLFLIYFMHSLKITLTATPQDAIKSTP